MSKSEQCEHCNNIIPLQEKCCPHCGRPSLFPNVRKAGEKLEKEALDKRYEAAIEDANTRGCVDMVRDFESEVSVNSKAVINRSMNETDRMASSEGELYATFYQCTSARIRIPSGEKWDTLRAVADRSLFPGYYEEIHFAALSLDNQGLFNYGECMWEIDSKMIAHRASVFEENSVLFMDHKKILMSEAYNLPKGYRAIWNDRGKLCVAKLAKEITDQTNKNNYSVVLLKEGRSSAEDNFIEVHIFGPMTIRTLENITLKQAKSRKHRLFLKVLRERLDKIGAGLTVC